MSFCNLSNQVCLKHKKGKKKSNKMDHFIVTVFVSMSCLSLSYHHHCSFRLFLIMQWI